MYDDKRVEMKDIYYKMGFYWPEDELNFNDAVSKVNRNVKKVKSVLDGLTKKAGGLYKEGSSDAQNVMAEPLDMKSFCEEMYKVNSDRSNEYSVISTGGAGDGDRLVSVIVSVDKPYDEVDFSDLEDTFGEIARGYGWDFVNYYEYELEPDEWPAK